MQCSDFNKPESNKKGGSILTISMNNTNENKPLLFKSVNANITAAAGTG